MVFNSGFKGLMGLLLGYVLDGVWTFVRLRKMPVHCVASTASGIALLSRASCPIINWSSCTGGVQAGLPLSNIVVEVTWSYASSLLYVFTTLCFVVCFLLGNSPASEFYMPTFQNTLSVLSS